MPKIVFFFLYSTNSFAFILWKKQFKHLLFKEKNDTIFKSIKTGHFGHIRKARTPALESQWLFGKKRPFMKLCNREMRSISSGEIGHF